MRVCMASRWKRRARRGWRFRKSSTASTAVRRRGRKSRSGDAMVSIRSRIRQRQQKLVAAAFEFDDAFVNPLRLQNRAGDDGVDENAEDSQDAGDDEEAVLQH